MPLALAIGGLAYLRRWLTAGGAAAAAVVGSLIFAAGWTLTVALLFFFFSSRLLELIWRARTPDPDPVSVQHGRRHAGQVLAVGAVPAAAAAAFMGTGDPAWELAALAALGFATADTWATTIGMSASGPPRLCGFGPPVAAGLSGGMTLRGTLGSLCGALAIGVLAARTRPDGASVLLGVTALGFAGGLLDSLLGATVQTRYRCAVCGRVCERKVHCGRPLKRVRGVLSNAAVNLVASLATAAAALGL